jgi:hypothetical protein
MSEALAVTPAAGGDKDAQAVANIFTPQGLGLMTSLPLGTIDEKIAAASVRAGEAARFADLIGEEFTILDVVIHPVDLLIDEDTGEQGTFPRTVLVTDRGNVAAVSTGLLRELGTLASLFGPAQTWRAQGGVRVKTKQVNTRRGFRTYALMPVVSAATKSKK